jgi:hypothetical protein
MAKLLAPDRPGEGFNAKHRLKVRQSATHLRHQDDERFTAVGPPGEPLRGSPAIAATTEPGNRQSTRPHGVMPGRLFASPKGPGVANGRAARHSACGYAAVQDALAPTGRHLNSPEIPDSPAAFPEHDPEKWEPVFPRDKREAFARRSCSNNKIERDDDSKKSHPALDSTKRYPGRGSVRDPGGKPRKSWDGPAPFEANARRRG